MQSAPCWSQDAPQRSTWLGGARCVVVASVGSGSGGLDGRRRGPGGGFVNADFRLELWEAPPSVDVLKLLNLGTKSQNANPETRLVSTHHPHAPHTWHIITHSVWHTLQTVKQVSTSRAENWTEGVWRENRTVSGGVSV